jgi:hypothetical protein
MVRFTMRNRFVSNPHSYVSTTDATKNEQLRASLCETLPSASVFLEVLENYVCTLMQAYSVLLNNVISVEIMKNLSAP